ncbi:hypothetical protein ScalyP_jg6357 [Parmales sp. scaly parma]|nr:hypothetical protein ScalyP_jg6357 [Parmales sp. scaly parma]
MEKFRASATGEDVELPVVFVGSNSAKDGSYEKRFGKKRGSVMVLATVKFEWFAEWNVHARGEEYDALKKREKMGR